MEDIIGLDLIRLIFLTIHRSAQMIFKIYGAEIEKIEANQSKSRKKASANLLRLWRSIREKMNILAAIPEEDILSLDYQEFINLVQMIALKHKRVNWKLVIMNILDMAIKKIHPLDNRLAQYVAKTTSADLMEQLRDSNIENRDFNNRNLNWMRLGQCHCISSLASDCLNQKHPRSYCRSRLDKF